MNKQNHIKCQAILLANGKFPKHPIPLKILDEKHPIICCDGSAKKLLNYGKNPAFIIGDLDSITNKMKLEFSNCLIPIKNQRENDLRKSINWIEKNGYKKITILGATGYRDDHTIGNIFSLLEFNFKIKIDLITDYGIFSTCNNYSEFKSFIGQQVSIFTTDKKLKITSSNLKYGLKNKTLDSIYAGTLNESLSEKFSIHCVGGRTLIYRCHKLS